MRSLTAVVLAAAILTAGACSTPPPDTFPDRLVQTIPTVSAAPEVNERIMATSIGPRMPLLAHLSDTTVVLDVMLEIRGGEVTAGPVTVSVKVGDETKTVTLPAAGPNVVVKPSVPMAGAVGRTVEVWFGGPAGGLTPAGAKDLDLIAVNVRGYLPPGAA